jgi:hypothetical protein
MRKSEKLTILLVVSVVVNVVLAGYAIFLNGQSFNIASENGRLKIDDYGLRNEFFVLLRDDILRGSSTLLNQSVIYIQQNKTDVATYNIDQSISALRYYSWACTILGGDYANLLSATATQKNDIFNSLIDIRSAAANNTVKDSQLSYLQNVSVLFDYIASHMVDSGQGVYSISDLDSVVSEFIDLTSGYLAT